MAYTARELIARAYYLSGIVSRSLQSVTGDQFTEGLGLLNDLLAVKHVNKGLIPFYKEYSLNTVINQETYLIPSLVTASTVTFNIGAVRYAMLEVPRNKYHGYPRVDNIVSLPFSWYQERVKDGTNISLYFLPNQVYQIKIWGKFGLDVIANENIDLSLTYERTYLTYLRYALAEFMCSDQNISFPPQAADKLKELETMNTDTSPMDLTMKKISTLQKGITYNWGIINLSRGWEP